MDPIVFEGLKQVSVIIICLYGGVEQFVKGLVGELFDELVEDQDGRILFNIG